MGRRAGVATAMAKVAALLLVALALADPLPGLLGTSGATTLAASWHVREVLVDATVEPDGDLAVRETRTFDLPESFRWVEQWIPLAGCQGIEAITVSEVGPSGPVTFTEIGGAGAGTSGDVDGAGDPVDAAAGDPASAPSAAPETPGTFLVTRDPDRVTIRYWFEPRAGRRTFTLTYLVKGPVVVHNDVASLPPATFVEARVTFPPGLVPAAANQSGRDGLPGILADEEAWAREANRRRADIRLEFALAAGILLAAAAWGWWLMRRYGVEPRPAESPTYYREPPDTYSPAELGVLWRFGEPGPEDFTATVLDLARRG